MPQKFYNDHLGNAEFISENSLIGIFSNINEIYKFIIYIIFVT